MIGESIERAHALGAVTAALFGKPEHRERLGRYILLEQLGAGGMGLVFAAYDPQLDRRVALKLLRRELASDVDGDARARVLREARAMARLSHPHVVTVHEVGEEDGRIYIAMEHAAGGTLRAWTRTEPKRGWREIVRLFVAAGRGLAAAHAAGVIHRDFKPENVLITADGEPRVADFGLARTGSPDGALHITHDDLLAVREPDTTLDSLTAGIAGTPAYMAPEVMDGAIADAASDQFSFCVALFEALEGRRPFEGEDFLSLRQAIEAGPPSESSWSGDTPARVRRLVNRGLSPVSGDRHPELDELLDALERCLGSRRRSRRLGLALVLGMVSTGVLGMTFAPAPLASPVVETCSGGSDRVAQIWNRDRADALLGGIESVGLDPKARARVQALGDQYAQAWATAHHEACLDTAVRGVQSTARLDARMHCLDGRLRALQGTLRGLEARPALELSAVAKAFEGLPSLDECLDPHRDPSPLDAGERARRLQMEEELARALALELAGDPVGAAELALAQVAVAEDLDDDLARARSLRTLGTIEVRSGVAGQATEHLAAARIAAERVGDDRLLTRVLILQVTDAVLARDLEGARRQLEVAGAVLSRLGGDPALEASLEGRRGVVAYYEGDYESAAAHYRTQLELIDTLGPEGEDERASALGNLGLALRDMGDYEAALRSMEEGRALRARLYGPVNPYLAPDDLNIAMVLDSLGDYEPALAVAKRGLSVAEAAYGPDSLDAAQIHEGIAFIYDNLERYEEGLEHHGESQRILRVLGQERHPDMAMSLGNAGFALKELGRPEDGLPLQIEALEIWETALGDDHPDVSFALRDLALTYLELGRPEAAIPLLERALEIRVAHDMPRLLLGDGRFYLATALQRSEPRRALELARLALADYEAAPPHHTSIDQGARDLIAELERVTK